MERVGASSYSSSNTFHHQLPLKSVIGHSHEPVLKGTPLLKGDCESTSESEKKAYIPISFSRRSCLCFPFKNLENHSSDVQKVYHIRHQECLVTHPHLLRPQRYSTKETHFQLQPPPLPHWPGSVAVIFT